MMTSPAGLAPLGTSLSWSHTNDLHWYLRRDGTSVCIVYWNKTGYSITSHYTQTDNTRYDTLDEAKAVAIALIAMRSK